MIRLKEALTELNTEIKRTLKFKHGEPKTFTRNELYEIYKKNNGRCAYCGFNLRPVGKAGEDGSHFQFIYPPKKAEDVNVDNLVLVCNMHKKKYTPRKRLRERIPDLDSFADLVEALTKAVREKEEAIQLKDPQAAYLEEKVRRIKHEVNQTLEDIAIHLYYKCFLEDEPKEVVARVEEDNTIADAIEKVAEGKEEGKEEVTENVKQVMKTKQYKVFRW